MPEVGPDIGAMLRETRMRARIDIGEVEMRTKIRAKYLRAIENEEWDLLPGPVYVKSFLRTYGDYLGLDSRLLVDEYKRRYELAPDSQHRPLSAAKRERERAVRGPRAPAVPSWLIIAVVLVAAGVALYLIGRGHGTPTPKVNAGVTNRTHTQTRPIQTVTTTTTTAARTTPAPTLASLKLVPTGTVWVCVETPDGKPLIDGVTETSGEIVPTVSNKTALLVTPGNAEVTVTANGKPYTLTGTSAIGLKVTPTGVTTVPTGPTCA